MKKRQNAEWMFNSLFLSLFVSVPDTAIVLYLSNYTIIPYPDEPEPKLLHFANEIIVKCLNT